MINRTIKKIIYLLGRTHNKLDSFYHKRHQLPKIVFVHIPKCGGASISNSLWHKYKSSYHRAHIIPAVKASKMYYETQNEYLKTEQLLPELSRQIIRGTVIFYSAAKEKKCLTGHICYNSKMINTLKEMDYKFITLIRDPVDMFFSHYFYNYYKEVEFYKTKDTFEEYLCNNRNLGSRYIRYFGGLRSDNDYSSNKAINRALDNLKEYEVIGQLENMDDFVRKIENKLGLSLEVPKINSNPAPRKKYNDFKNSAKKREMVKEISQPNLKLIEKMKAVNFL